jgi:hypothetical protein
VTVPERRRMEKRLRMKPWLAWIGLAWSWRVRRRLAGRLSFCMG